MPELYHYLNAFGLTEGAMIGGYQLHLVDPRESTILRYKEYQYDGALDFTPMTGASEANLLSHFTSLINTTHSVRGTRDYYDCTFTVKSIIADPHSGVIRMTFHGHAEK